MTKLARRERVAVLCVAVILILLARCFLRDLIPLVVVVAVAALCRCLSAPAHERPSKDGDDAATTTGDAPDLRCGDIVIDSRTGTSRARRMSLVVSAWRDPSAHVTYTLNYDATRDAAGERMRGWKATGASSRSPFQNLDVVRFRHANASFRDELRRRVQQSEPGEVLDVVEAALRRVGDPAIFLSTGDDDRETWIRNTSHWKRVATERDVFLAPHASLPARALSQLRRHLG